MPGGKKGRVNTQKLWTNKSTLHPDIEEFTVGDDYILDQALIEYECRASIAHANMLGRIEILTRDEVRRLVRELNAIRERAEQGRFLIRKDQEDVHTAIEQHLTEKLGDLGKKIHTGRSRNDQVLAALRLYYKENLQQLDARITALVESLRGFKRTYGRINYPGYTHTRKAMPSSFGMWSASFIDALADDRRVLKTVLRIIDQSPLGSGAGYGVPLPVDRAYTAKLLGFTKVQQNPMYVQHSRGKFESFLLHLLAQIMYDLNRCATDIIFFSMPEVGFFQLSDEITTGSSIMPQKKNPDALELVRAKYHAVVAAQSHVQYVASNLISGYHRDLQETKAPVMKSFSNTLSSLSVMKIVISNVRIDPGACRRAMSSEIFSTNEVYSLVAEGVAFRDAYRAVATKYR